jgi:Zn-dependent protease with chaperone function
MSLASAQLEYLKQKNPTSVDRFAFILASLYGVEKGIYFAARMDYALALLNGYQGQTASDLRAYLSEKEARCKRIVGDFSKLASDTSLASVDTALVPASTPNAFALAVKADQSYAIGLDESLLDLLTILTHASFAAYTTKDIRIYQNFCLHSFDLYYHHMPPHPCIVDNCAELAAQYVSSFAGYRDMLLDIREMSIRFLLGHESAHVALKHFESGSAARFSFIPGNENSEVSAFDHQACEYDADAWAAEHMFLHASNDQRKCFAATQTPPLIMMFLGHMSALGREIAPLYELMRHKHPPAQERHVRLRTGADRYTKDSKAVPTLILEIGDFIAKHDDFFRDGDALLNYAAARTSEVWRLR